MCVCLFFVCVWGRGGGGVRGGGGLCDVNT